MDSKLTPIFARRLREEREKAGISQIQLAQRITDLLGVAIHPTAITKLEKQGRAVRLDEAVAIAEALEVPLTMLISAKGMTLNAQIQEIAVKLAAATAMLQAAMGEVEHRQSQVLSLQEQLAGLQEQADNKAEAEIQQELLDDLRTAQWPS